MAWRGRFGFAAGRERLSIVTIPGAEGALAGAYSTASTYNPDGTVASQTLPAAGWVAGGDAVVRLRRAGPPVPPGRARRLR